MGRNGDGTELREHSIRVGFTWLGKHVRETLSIPPTPANHKYAIQLVAKIKKEIRMGTFVYAEYFPKSDRAEKRHVITFGAACDAYILSVGQRSAATRSQYANALKVWKSIFGADTRLDALDHATLSSQIGGYPWASAKLQNNYLIPLRGVFKLHYHGALAAGNPLEGVTNARVVKKVPDPLSADERDRILVHIGTHYDARLLHYFTTAFFTGMRPEELIALKWGDVDWKHQTIRVQRVRTFKGSERDDTKTGVERDVDMVPQVVDALKSMKAWTFVKGVDGDIFESPYTGRAWHDDRSQRDNCWTPTLKALGIRRRRAYSTRHTYCTAALMHGVNPAYIAAQAGHSVKMLFDVYSRWINGADAGLQRARMAEAFQQRKEG